MAGSLGRLATKGRSSLRITSSSGKCVFRPHLGTRSGGTWARIPG
jgi:hypothetical protein